jgi:hypothetical protein
VAVPPCIGCQSDAQPIECGKATINGFMGACILFATDPKNVAVYLKALCPPHREIAIQVLIIMAHKNGLPIPDLLTKLSAVFGVSESWAKYATATSAEGGSS